MALHRDLRKAVVVTAPLLQPRPPPLPPPPPPPLPPPLYPSSCPHLSHPFFTCVHRHRGFYIFYAVGCRGTAAATRLCWHRGSPPGGPAPSRTFGALPPRSHLRRNFGGYDLPPVPATTDFALALILLPFCIEACAAGLYCEK
jgi:hypothetical protein